MNKLLFAVVVTALIAGNILAFIIGYGAGKQVVENELIEILKRDYKVTGGERYDERG